MNVQISLRSEKDLLLKRIKMYALSFTQLPKNRVHVKSMRKKKNFSRRKKKNEKKK